MTALGLGIGTHAKDVLRPAGFRQDVYSLLLCTLAINILSLSLPVMTLQVYDRILPNPGTGTLSVLVAGVCLAIVLEVFLRLSRAYVVGRAGAAYEHRMACSAIQKVLNADLTRMKSYGIGEHLHRMGSVGKLKDFYNGYALTVLAELAFVPLFFALIVYISGYLVVVPAVILLAFAAVSVWKGHQLRRALGRRDQVDDKRFNFLIESLEGVHTLKAFALERFFERRYEALEEDSTFANYEVTQETARAFNSGAIFSHLMVASVISAGAWFVLEGALTSGGLIATLLLSGRMMQPVQRALALWVRYQEYALARKGIEELCTVPQREILPRDAHVEVTSEGALSVRGIGFRYRDEDKPILRDVNVELKPGDAILISGSHGAGKTTLLDLIAGIYRPSTGKILVDGADVRTYAPEGLVRHVGFIRTQALIFRGTIRDNITCFGQTDERQARQVAALLGVDKDVARLPGGFDTFLSGDSTDSIPPGLRQRIAIVRVLATKPRLILFDNADRALDKNGYTTMYNLLARLKGNASMIIVSDDQNIRSLAERHYELMDGALSLRAQPGTRGDVRPYRELKL